MMMKRIFPIQKYIKKYRWDETVKKYDVCFVLDTGWNTLDEHYPILCWLKEMYPNVRILSLVLAENAGQMIHIHEQRFAKLLDVSDSCLVDEWTPSRIPFFRRISYSIYKRIYYKREEQYLHSIFSRIDIGSFLFAEDDSRIMKIIRRNYPHEKSRYVMHPQCPFVRMENTKVDIYEDYDIYASSSPDEVGKRHANNKIYYTGSTKLDPWWIDKTKKILKRREGNALKVVSVVMPRLSQEGRITESEIFEFTKWLREQKKYHIRIKFHPRDTQCDIKKFMSRIHFTQEKSKIECVDDSIASMAVNSYCVIILGHSTTAPEVMFLGCPLIEFYSPEQHTKSYVCADGRWGTFLRLHKLSICVSTCKELHYALDNISKEQTEIFQNKFNKFLPADHKSIKNIANILLYKNLSPDLCEE